jgi:hypothetical protein
MQAYIYCEHNSFISDQLKRLQLAHDNLKLGHDAKMDTICKEIVKLAGEAHTMNAAVQSAQLVSLKTKLEVLHKETVNSNKQVKVLRSLHIPILERRHTQMDL